LEHGIVCSEKHIVRHVVSRSSKSEFSGFVNLDINCDVLEPAGHTSSSSRRRRRASGFADIFVPDGGIFLDVVGEEGDALLGIEVDDFDVEGAEPVDAALEGAAFAYDDARESELADEAAAIPAGREGGDHG